MFQLHERLSADTVLIKNLELCELRYLPDGEVPWLVLIPRLENIIEIIDLSREDKMKLMDEISYVSEGLKKNFELDKINVGALGNMVPQLHIHVIGRLKSDRAWPGAIWGTSKDDKENEEEIIKKLISIFEEK